ncbi:MBL fold metallo-hydrolase [Rathayibacter agropyri]
MTSVPDGRIQLHPARWFGRDEAPTAIERALLDDSGFLVASTGSLVVQSGDQVLAVDTGLGPTVIDANSTHPALGEMRGGGLPRAWRAAGLPAPTKVVLTHLHEDHTGWWSSTTEFGEHLRSLPTTAGRADLDSHPMSRLSQRWDPVEGGEMIASGVQVLSLPGHTPGHLGLRIASHGETLIAFGDSLHSTLQVDDPSMNAFVDLDPAGAAATRRALVDSLDGQPILGYGNHFADVAFGHVIRRRWVPVG